MRRHVFSSPVLISFLKLTFHVWKTVCESRDFDGSVTVNSVFLAYDATYLVLSCWCF